MADEHDPRRDPEARARMRIALMCSGLVIGMIGLSFAAVPLYDMFCRATGYGGTTQRAERAPDKPGEKVITVRFNADTARGLPWKFEPVEREIRVTVGEERLAFYRATNTSNRPIVGQASYNVSPDKAGIYFNKVACFCFTEQRLEPGETVEMPVSFFVDPSIATERSTRDVNTITLSYTFFELPEKQAALKQGQGTGTN
ncbi:MAG: cytochrome c oxidase assembly protein [Ferrovibrionaceae bacterium]